MTEKTMNFGDVEINYREFHRFNPPIHLDLVSVSKIISIQVKYGGKIFECYIRDKDGHVIRPLCIMIPYKWTYKMFLWWLHKHDS